MAYQVPKQWVHGNIPTAADMNKYSDAQNAIHDITGDRLYARPAAHALVGVDNDYHVFVHRYRWLYYQSTGTIEDIADPTNNTQTLSEDGEPTLLDLNTIGWLYPGKLYAVTGCTWAAESRDP
jgi:hypothetical protein